MNALPAKHCPSDRGFRESHATRLLKTYCILSHLRNFLGRRQQVADPRSPCPIPTFRQSLVERVVASRCRDRRCPATEACTSSELEPHANKPRSESPHVLESSPVSRPRLPVETRRAPREGATSVRGLQVRPTPPRSPGLSRALTSGGNQGRSDRS